MLSEVDIYADEYEPILSGTMWTTYGIRFPRPSEMKSADIPYFLYVEVDTSGMISLSPYTYWQGKKEKDLTWEERREVYEFLIEWEFAEWRRVGPEDSELFATKKLSEEFGLDARY